MRRNKLFLWRRVLCAGLTAAMVAMVPGTGALAAVSDTGSAEAEGEILTVGTLEEAGLNAEAVYAAADVAQVYDGDAGIVASVSPAANADAEKSTNIYHDYQGNWARQPYSYLVQGEGGNFFRLEYIEGKNAILLEEYNSSCVMQGSRWIDCELKLFGGFYVGSDAYYFVFGQPNSEEKDTAEVYRIVKYSKAWVRQTAYASVTGANTYVPFEAGSCDFAETADFLYIRTCHTMYKSDDGNHHQANVQLVVKKDTMELTDSIHEVLSSTVGYVSHSFNQFVALDGDRIVTADHGDAYPRAMFLGYYEAPANGGMLHYSTQNNFAIHYKGTNLMIFGGAIGDNRTGATLGGLEVSSSSYLTVGSSIAQNNAFATNITRNVWLNVADKTDITKNKTIYLTSYAEGAETSVSNAYLVKADTDLYAVLWQEMKNTDHPSYYAYPKDPVTKYVYVDGKGQTVSGVRTLAANLSDCKPTMINGKLMWYTTHASVPIFYTLEPAPNKEKITAFVTRFYNVILERQPDENGLKDWVNQLMKDEKTAVGLAYGFIFSDEYKNKSLCNEHFVKNLYRSFMGREYDQGGYDNWMKKLENGTTREEVFNGFVMSDEFKKLAKDYGISLGNPIEVPAAGYGTIPTGYCAVDGCGREAGVRTFAKRLYTKALDREAESKGLEYWIGRLSAPGKDRIGGFSAAEGFFLSEEFVGHKYSDQVYIEHLYRTYLGREAEPEGLAYWMKKVSDGVAAGRSRDEVLAEVRKGFAGSTEFANLCKQYGIIVW